MRFGFKETQEMKSSAVSIFGMYQYSIFLIIVSFVGPVTDSWPAQVVPRLMADPNPNLKSVCGFATTKNMHLNPTWLFFQRVQTS